MSQSLRILVTPRSVTRDGHPALDRLRAAGMEVIFCEPGVQPDEEMLCRLLPGCHGYLAGVEPITARVVEAATSLRVISRNGTGVDTIDHEAARKAGIEIRRAEGANARGVAELTIAHLLAMARALPYCHSVLKSGGWQRPAPGFELEGKVLGVTGWGRVGRIVGALARGLGMSVMIHDPLPPREFVSGPDCRLTTFPEMLAGADVISLHCPPPGDGRPLIDSAALAMVKPGALLINTARHDLIDPEAVLAALASGRLAAVALDVFAEEPPIDRRLLTHPHVTASPHIGGYTRESIDRAMQCAVDNLLDVLG